MIYDVWIRVIYFLRIGDLFIFRQTNQFLRQCVENDLIKNFPWYRFHKKLQELPNLFIQGCSICSGRYRSNHHGCSFQTLQMQNDLLLKITDYLGISKFIKICHCDSYVFFQCYQIQGDIFVLKPDCLNDYSINLNDLTVSSVTDLPIFDNYLTNSVTISDSNFCLSQPQLSFDFSKCSVSLIFDPHQTNKFSMIMNHCFHTERNCIVFHTDTINHWIFHHEWCHRHRFFHVWYNLKTQKIQCSLTHQIFTNYEILRFGAIYFKNQKQLSIVEINSQSLKWKIIKDIYIYGEG
jgi:hypothetical protein